MGGDVIRLTAGGTKCIKTQTRATSKVQDKTSSETEETTNDGNLQ